MEAKKIMKDVSRDRKEGEENGRKKHEDWKDRRIGEAAVETIDDVRYMGKQSRRGNHVSGKRGRE